MKKINKRLLLLPLLLLFCVLLTGCLSTKGLSISIGYKKVTMYVGDSLYLSTNSNELGEGNVTWTTTNPEVATVSNDGEVVALQKGYTYVEAKFNDESSKVYVEVIEKEVKRTLSINGKQMVIVNETITLTADINIEFGESIIWSSSDEEIATVTDEGVVTGVKTGLVSIKASLSTDPSIYNTISVLVRTGSGIQDVIINKIYNETYEINGDMDLTELSDKVVETVNNTKDAIIGVSKYQKSGTTLAQTGVGSGVIYERVDLGNGKYQYTILSNYHVVEDADKVKIYIGGDVDKEYDAVVVKTNEAFDLSMITFEYDKLIEPIVLTTNSDEVKVGDFVIAIGNPNGYDYYNSVTFGIASYVKRTLDDETSVYIQHDAAINPGNSGGALLNLDGELIGINTMKIAKVTVEGMGFAIDIDTINIFLNE